MYVRERWRAEGVDGSGVLVAALSYSSSRATSDSVIILFTLVLHKKLKKTWI